MKKLLLRALAVLALLLVLAVTVPLLISWDQYKKLAETQFAFATGRTMHINGALRLTLLPNVGATITDVVIDNPPSAVSKNFATIKQIDVGLALRPLLSKKIHITHVTIDAPAVTLETLVDGGNNWQFSATKPSTQVAAQNDTVTNDEDSHFSIDDITISKGFVRVVNTPQKTQNVIGPVDGNFAVGGLNGPFNGRGTIMVTEKLPIRFDATINAVSADATKPINFKLGLNMVGGLANADFTGAIVRAPDMSLRVESVVTTKALDKIYAMVIRNPTATLPTLLSPKSTLTGVISYQANMARIDNLQLTSGGMELTAAAEANMGGARPRFTVDITHMALPPTLQSKALAPTAESQENKKPLAATLADTFKAATGLLDTTVPDTAFDVVLTANQLLLPQQPPLRDVRLALSSNAGGITIQTIEAKLQGDTMVHVNGTLQRQENGTLANATLNTQITSDNIAAIGGAQKTGAAQPINVQTTMTLDRQALRLDPLRIVKQGETMSGAVVYQPNQDPALDVALKGSSLNLDALLGQKNNATAATSNAAPTNNPSNKTDPFALLNGLKAKIAIDLARVVYSGKTFGGVMIDALATERGLTLNRADIGDLGGLVVTSKGSIGGLNPLKNVDLKAQGRTPNLSATMRALGNDAAQNLGASQFDATIKGDDAHMALALNGTIDQGKIVVNGAVDHLSNQPHYSGTILVQHPETASMVRNFANMQPQQNFGTFLLQTKFAYGADMIQAKDLVIKLGSAGTVNGDVDIAQGRSIHAALKADRLDLTALTGDVPPVQNNAPATTGNTQTTEWSRAPIDLNILRGLNGDINVAIAKLLYKKFEIGDFKTNLACTNDTLTIKQLQGQLFGTGRFDVTGQLVAGASNNPHRGSATVTIDKVDGKKLFNALGSQGLSQGVIDVTQNLSFVGVTPHALVASLQGKGSVRITNGIINGIDLDALAAKLDKPNSLSDFAAILDQARAGGQTPIGDVTSDNTIQNGIVTLTDIPIKTQKTAMLTKGTIDMPNKNLDLLGQISFTEQKNLPSLTLFVKGPISAPQKNFDTRGFTQFYAEKYASKLGEKLQDKLQDKLGGKLGQLLGAPEPTPSAPPVVPTVPATNNNAAPPPPPINKKDEALKQLGTQMLNNLLGGGR